MNALNARRISRMFQVLLEMNLNVALNFVRRRAREFGVAIAMSDLIGDFDKAVAHRQELP